MKGSNGQILTFVALSIALVGCNGAKVSEKISKNKLNVFRYPMVTNPTTLDPGKVTDQDTHDILQNVVDTLVIIGENNEIQPHLAEKYWPENGGKTYVFELKKGVQMLLAAFTFLGPRRSPFPPFNSPDSPIAP